MRIRCWGSRGSIPVSGKEYLNYGGDTTCLEIRPESGETIIVDAGTGIRRLGNLLVEQKRFQYHFIFTHAHWDHVTGFPFFKPLYFQRAELLIHRCPFQNRFVEKILTKVMSPPHFPVKYSELKAKIVYEEACPAAFEIGSIQITPIPISHPNGGSGYKFKENGKSFVFLTDNELGFVHPGGLERKAYSEFCTGTDLLIHDAEYTPAEYKKTKTWGHSTFTHAVELAADAGVEKLGLFHLNQERSDAAVDEIVAACRQRFSGKGRRPECFAVGGGGDMVFHL